MTTKKENGDAYRWKEAEGEHSETRQKIEMEVGKGNDLGMQHKYYLRTRFTVGPEGCHNRQFVILSAIRTD